MFGSSSKHKIRQKALAELMKEEGPAIAIKIKQKSAPADAMMGEEEDEMMAEQGEKPGLEQMQVTSEEKAMILSMRKKKSGEGAEESMHEGAEMEEMA